MSQPGDLARLEAILDASGVATRIEMLLPVGVRPRQLPVRSLLLGILICLANDRPAHLRRIHRALIGLPETQQWRLGVICQAKSGPHRLTYRQTERTFGLLNRALCKDRPDGRPSEALCEVMDRLLEASVQVLGMPESNSYAIDWSDYESFARPPHKDGACADTEAAWGHRKVNHPAKSEMFFGYYLQAATIVKQQNGPPVPELVRRVTLACCKEDPPEQIVPVIKRMADNGIRIGETIVDSGYSYRQAETFAAPIRALGAELVMDLHPNDRGIKGTFQGAVIANGNPYCPATPKALFQLGPARPGATEAELAAHDQKTAELSRYKLSPLTAPDRDGYQRVICPAAKGKIRCPHRPTSMSLSHKRPTITSPPEHPPLCCTQQTITVPGSVAAKTAQKHDYPSASHRASYARRTASERSFSKVCDPASNDIKRGWCRLMGLTPNAIMLTCVFIVANIRTTDAFAARQAENERRAACGIEPKHRRKRRTSLHEITAKANAPPAIAA